MKNRLTKRILAAALCLTVLFTFTACDYEGALAYFDDTYAILPIRNADDNPTFDEMVRSYVHYDYDAFSRYADKTEAAIRDGNEQKAEYMYKNLREACEQISTLYQIAELEYRLDVTNAVWANEDTYLYNLMDKALGRVYEIEELLLGHTITEDDVTETVSELTESEIVNEYYRTLFSNPYSEDPEFWEYLSNLLMKAIRLRNAEAVNEGYANYIEKAFADPYVVPFGKSEAISEIFAERASDYARLNEAKDASEDLHQGEFDGPVREQFLSDIESFLPKVSGDMSNLFSDMQKRGLIVAGDRENSAQEGLSSELTAYKAPVIYLYTYGDDYKELRRTAVHEFGHAYSQMLSLKKGVERGPYYGSDMASAESQSMGLEGLFYASIADNCDWVTPWVDYEFAFSPLQNVVQCSLENEMELAMYENDDMTPDELCKLYSDLREKYGYSRSYDVSDPKRYYFKYGFLFITQFVEFPLYLRDYIPAGFTALQLMLMADKDFEKAAKTYMIIENYGSDGEYGYEHMMRDAGLVDINDEAAIRAAVSDIFDYYNELLERTGYEN